MLESSMPELLPAELLTQAQTVVRQGGLLAYPTEAVWGLGCAPDNEQALAKLLALKQRPWHKGLVVVAADFAQLEPWLLPLTAAERTKVLAAWEGTHLHPHSRAVTWVLPCQPQVSKLLKGEHSSLAVRVSQHPVVRQLCEHCGPLVSTSANPAGFAPALTAAQVSEYFADASPLIIPGELGQQQQPSEIRTLAGTVLR